jgi:hypothetical protein
MSLNIDRYRYLKVMDFVHVLKAGDYHDSADYPIFRITFGILALIYSVIFAYSVFK